MSSNPDSLESQLDDLGPVILSQPYLLHKFVIVRKIAGGRGIKYVYYFICGETPNKGEIQINKYSARKCRSPVREVGAQKIVLLE